MFWNYHGGGAVPYQASLDNELSSDLSGASEECVKQLYG